MGGSRLLAIAVLLAAGQARAEPCAVAPAEAARRRALIERQLEADAGPSRTWNLAWGIGLAASAAGNTVMAFHPEWTPLIESDDALRAAYAITAVKSTLGASSRLVMPLRVRRPPPPTGDPCADLAAAEAALMWTARKQRQTYLLGYLGGGALHVAGGLVLGLRYGAWEEAAFAVATGSLITGIMGLTQPRWSWYLWRDLPRPAAGGARSWLLLPDVAPGRVGIVFTLLR